ncbi:MAG: hypothetical protein ACC656_13480, partial [Candidatus Heimdallarchaeota archaeon]
LQKFNELVSAATLQYAGVGNTGSENGFTGPVAFHATASIPGHRPTVGPHEPVVYGAESDVNPYPKQKLKNSFKNDLQGNTQAREDQDADRFGRKRRRRRKLGLDNPKRFKGKFSEKRKKIKSFKDFDFEDSNQKN